MYMFGRGKGSQFSGLLVGAFGMAVLASTIAFSTAADARSGIARTQVRISEKAACNNQGCASVTVTWKTQNCEDGSIKLTAYYESGASTRQVTRSMATNGRGSYRFAVNANAKRINRVRYFCHCKIVTGSIAGDLNVP